MGDSRVHSPIGSGTSKGLALRRDELGGPQSGDPAGRADGIARAAERGAPVGRPGDERSAWTAALFGAAVFAAAFLVFLVQPMVGKRILPWFGGVPAVWTVCLAFYQTVLFAGYAYAHVLIRCFGPKQQLAIHAAAVVAAILALPVLPEAPPDLEGQADPTWTVIASLSGSVALPFLVLASTGPLVQFWLARAHPAVSPYSLYAVSNIGSFLALFAYPFAIEPRLSVSESGSLWAWAFASTGMLVLACAWTAIRSGSGRSPTSAQVDEAEVATAPRHSDALRWLALSATAVVVLMGVTNKLCLDVASIPFLWIVPLATYLLTFVVAFGSERAYRRAPCGALAVVSFLITRAIEIDDLIVFQAGAYCLLLFSTCMILHGELYRSRPPATDLTRFYLCVSAGGALGGLFVGLAAPALFDDYHELSLGLLLTLALVLSIGARDPGASSMSKDRAGAGSPSARACSPSSATSSGSISGRIRARSTWSVRSSGSSPSTRSGTRSDCSGR
ncbi:MAG: hypothetical protein IPK00_07265 [Deltaproteobacteria bacterium]|nr:hypothetical protein [Deltaproteobacteria bacterium]